MFQVYVIQNHAKMAEHANLSIGDPVLNANARVLFWDLFALNVSILTQLRCDPYTETYQRASPVTVYDLRYLTKPHVYSISPFCHIIPQPLTST